MPIYALLSFILFMSRLAFRSHVGALTLRSPNSITPTSPKAETSPFCRVRHGEVGVVEFGLYEGDRRTHGL